MPTVSIIVPVYNAETALSRCIESILHQEFRDLELILVNDGSSDSSKEICERYAVTDERVRVINKANSGVSDTRNRGIEAASGKYIQFLDADDWITEDSTKLLVRTAEEKNADLVVAEFYRVVGDNLSRKGSILSDKVLDVRAYADQMAESPADYYYGVIWNKLYRRDLIMKYGIRMDRDISFCEDFIFNLEYILHCKRIAPLQAPVYYYVKTEGSLVAKNMNPARLVQMKTSVYEYYDRFFRGILDESEYRAKRIEIASFLVSAATDDFAIPILPGTRRVGQETVGVHYRPCRNDVFTGIWLLNKAYEKYLSTAAMMHELEIRDVRVFMVLKGAGQVRSVREIADGSGISEAMVLLSLQKLASRKLIRFGLDMSGVSAEITEEAAGLCSDIDYIEDDLREVCCRGFTDAETGTAQRLYERVMQNLRKAVIPEEKK